jgi:RHS repeat-associated protein
MQHLSYKIHCMIGILLFFGLNSFAQEQESNPEPARHIIVTSPKPYYPPVPLLSESSKNKNPFVIANANSIGIVPPNPVNPTEVANVNRHKDVPVNLYTGTPITGLPIYAIEEAGMNVPVTLNYNASGLNAPEVSPWTGAGWGLNVNMITRVVRGLPDEGKMEIDSWTTSNPRKGYYRYGGFVGNPSYDPDSDTEPDIYYLNLNGASYKFMYSAQKQDFVFFPDADIKVTVSATYHILDNSGTVIRFNTWTVIMPDGIKYVFGQTNLASNVEESVEVENGWALANQVSPNVNLSRFDYYYKCNAVRSAWYLAKMESPYEHDIKFEYGVAQYSFYKLADSEATGSCPSTIAKKVNKVYVFGASPKKITAKTVEIEFNKGCVGNNTCSESFREDINDWSYFDDGAYTSKKLLNIVIKQVGDTATVLKYKFDYGYFKSAVSSEIAANITNYGHQHLRRLKLNGVTFPDGQKYSFKYWNEEDSTTFYGRLTYGIDHWGNLNGNNTIPTRGLIGVDDVNSSCGTLADARESNAIYAKYGLLKSMTSSLGSQVIFDYETHQAENFKRDLGVNYRQIGGSRIKTITSKDLIRKTKTLKRYSYLLLDGKSSGLITMKPIYRFQNGGVTYCNSSLYAQLMSEVNRPIVGYSFVKEITEDSLGNSLGHTDYYFDQPKKELSIRGSLVGSGYYNYDPQDFKPQDDFRVGNQLKVETYNQANQLLSSNLTTYTSAYTPDTNGLKIDSIFSKKVVKMNGVVLTGDAYYTYVRKFRTEENTNKTYSETGTNPVIKTTSYTYKDEMPLAYRNQYKGKHNQVVKVSTTDSFGYPVETLIKYAGDFSYYSNYSCIDSTCYDPEIGAYNCGYCTSIVHIPSGFSDSRAVYELLQKHMIAPIIEQVSKRNNKVVTASYQSFRQTNSVPNAFKYVPYITYVLDSLGKLNFTEVKFDSANNDQTIKDLAYKTEVTAFFYGRYGLPNSINVERGLYYTMNYDTTGTLLQTVYRRTNGTDFKFTTYEYDNKVFGISKATANFTKTFYDYYSDGRLKQIRDDQEYVVKHIEYAYKGQFNISSTGLIRDSTRNRIITRTPRIAVSDGASIMANSDDVEIDIEYSDGFNRTLQKIFHRASSSKKDILTGTNRVDKFERLYRSYLPVESTLQTGAVIDTSTILSIGQSFYADTRPFSENNQFENSPLGRINKTFGVGNAWKTANKSEQYNYLTAGIGLRKYVKTATGVDGSSNFTSYELFLIKNVDASGYTTLTYSDKEGRKIYDRTVSNISSTDTLTTAYLYDDVGRLSHIITPKAYNSASSFIDNSDFARQGVYIFRYDSKGRIAQKQVPNGGFSSMVYNRSNQIVLTQNSRQQLIKQWNFNQYDGFGRIVKSGKIRIDKTLDTLQKYFDNFQGVYQAVNTGYRLFEIPDNTASLGYTNRSFPSQIAIADSNVMSVNYFDTYNNWLTIDIEYQTSLNGESYSNSNPNDLPTGSKIRKLDDNTWLTSAIYYDNRRRPIETQSQNRFGGINRVDILYNFAGETIAERNIYRRPTKRPVIVRKDYELDHRGRVLTQWSKIYSSNSNFNDTTGKRIIARYSYDGIGRLKQKLQGQFSNADTIVRTLPPNQRLGETARRWIELRFPTISTNGFLEINNSNAADILYEGSINSIAGFLQTQQFKYHVRGGLSGINVDNSNNPDLSSGNFWSQKLTYDYNNRISGQTWKSSAAPTATYNYNYDFDGFSRLQTATYSNSGNTNQNHSVSGIEYDANGNITKLQRRGFRRTNVYGLIDDLTYNYGATGNTSSQLNTVTDNVETTWGTNDFKDYNKSGNDYDYYPDGSLKVDRNKGITLMEYNHLGLPEKITFTATKYIENVYTGDGVKIKQRIVNGSQSITTEYMGELLYRNDTLISVSHSEGKAVPDANGDNFDYQYFLTDYQGNTRYIYHQEGTQAVVLQETHYGPYGEVLYGVGIQGDWKFLYQGKEYVDLLNGYDFMWRQYDQNIGRFLSIDPDSQFSSGYVGMGNMPHIGIDPDGRWVHLVIGAIIGGAVNVYQNWDVIVKAGGGGKSWAKAAGFFGVGAVEGVILAAVPGAGLVKYGATFVAAVGSGTFKNLGNAVLGGHFDLSTKSILTNAAFATAATAVVSKVVAAAAPYLGKLARNLGFFREGGVYFKPSGNSVEELIGEGLTEEAAQKAAGTVLGGGQEAVKEGFKIGGKSFLTASELLRIQNAANRIGKPINVVGSRASGTAKAASDWDYVIENINSKEWNAIKNSLPGAPSRIDNLPRMIDIFKKLDASKPYITITPK